MDIPPSTSTMGEKVEAVDYKTGNYSLQNIAKAKEDVRNGVTYSKAIENRGIARSTLHGHVHNDYPDGCRPKRGRKYKLRTMDELQFVNYTNYCWDVGIPKTQRMLAPELPLYMEENGIVNTFKHGQPGDGWFQNLKRNHADIRIASPSTAKEHRLMNYTEKDWKTEISRFLRQYSGEDVLPSTTNIFIIELGTIYNPRHSNVDFDVMIAYNANSDILLPMVLHRDNVGTDVQAYFRETLAFEKTTDGHADLKSLHKYLQYIDSYIYWQKLPYPAIVYLQPELGQFLSFASWQWTTENSIMVYPLPSSVFRWLKSPGLGLLNKVRTMMQPYLMARIFPKTNDHANEHLLNALYQVIVHGRLLGHMKSTFCKLKLNTVRKAPKRKRDILQELLGGSKHFRKAPSAK